MHSNWSELRPPPDPAGWAEIADPRARVAAALTTLYRDFRKTRGMLASVIRDEPDVPAITPALSQMRSQFDAIATGLGKTLKAEARGEAIKTLRHAVQFQTWVSLVDLCGSDKEAVALVASWIFGKRR